ncbi:hypothetical protein C6501_12415 [Candidatus Poribacteria bacterium]|nr:MAG: hypothetical protein C6501_12415 [Candidatus Poribacteria bacterium]
MSITKQRLLCGVIPVLLLILAVSPVCFAQDGGYVNAEPHLRLGAGARSIGLGGAFTAIAEDATATVWNPAGLGSSADLSLNFSTQRLSLDRNHNFIALTKMLGSYGAIGLAATNFSVDDIPIHTDADGVEDGARFSRSVNAYSLSYGIAVGHFNIGLTGRMLMDNFGVESVENQSGFGGVDIGLMGHALHIDVDENQTPTFHYGIVAKYLGASLGEGTVPMVVDVGVAYDLYMGNVVTFSADIEQEFVNLDESPFSMRAGVEYTILTNKSTEFALRAGIRASRDNQNLFGGFGVNIAGLQVDYAIQDGMASEIDGVGSTHYVSVSYEF